MTVTMTHLRHLSSAVKSENKLAVTQSIPPHRWSTYFQQDTLLKRSHTLANILTNTGSLKPWNFFKADRLNFNDYSFLFGLFNSIPLAWRKLINSKDETSADTSA